MYVYDNGEKDYLVSFAGLTKRDGQFIVSREKIDNFTLDSLKGKEVLAGRRGGMPIVNFYNALENENVTGVNVNDSVDFANLTSAFVGGTGDFVNLFEPNATKLEKWVMVMFMIVLVSTLVRYHTQHLMLREVM